MSVRLALVLLAVGLCLVSVALTGLVAYWVGKRLGMSTGRAVRMAGATAAATLGTGIAIMVFTVNAGGLQPHTHETCDPYNW